MSSSSRPWLLSLALASSILRCSDAELFDLLHEHSQDAGSNKNIPHPIKPSSRKRQRPSTTNNACKDNRTYQSLLGMPCFQHKGLDCNKFHVFGYDEEEIQNLLDNCPQSCCVSPCGSSGRDRSASEVEIRYTHPSATVPINMRLERKLQMDKCQDNPEYISRIGFDCHGHSSYPCNELGILGFSEYDMKDLMANCPISCDVKNYCYKLSREEGCYAGWSPICQDDEEYKSKLGLKCKDHSGVDCSSLGLLGFSDSEVTDLMIHCPCSCGVECGTVTHSPTPAPTTAMPSSRPSAMPISSPSAPPTKFPTPSPSERPSSHPTAQPSDGPSMFPTSTPSARPSNTPSHSPSHSPTASPSSSPSASPTASPSNRPTHSPSTSPTFSPSNRPTNRPSHSPSTTPSHSPSSSPTSSPTARPSATPTYMPTLAPTDAPTIKYQPSAAPTEQHSSAPSTSFQPSPSPSVSPSASPSHFPTTSPTLYPSQMPSDVPSDLPSDIPSASPTHYPTLSPTLNPTHRPSDTPSVPPSHSMTPSASPTQSPTFHPTDGPSQRPSHSPTISFSPTTHPTHSASPSAAPTRNKDIVSNPRYSGWFSSRSEESNGNESNTTFLIFWIIISGAVAFSLCVLGCLCYIRCRSDTVYYDVGGEGGDEALEGGGSHPPPEFLIVHREPEFEIVHRDGLREKRRREKHAEVQLMNKLYPQRRPDQWL